MPYPLHSVNTILLVLLLLFVAGIPTYQSYTILVPSSIHHPPFVVLFPSKYTSPIKRTRRQQILNVRVQLQNNHNNIEISTVDDTKHNNKMNENPNTSVASQATEEVDDIDTNYNNSLQNASKETSNDTTTTTTATTTSNNDTTKNIVRRTWNPFRLAILRLKLTEPAMTSPLNYISTSSKNNGTFHCAYCHNHVFDMNAKYSSGTGWPSFWRTALPSSISYHTEWDNRIEVQCQQCHSHLGHVFLDGPSIYEVNQDILAMAPISDLRGGTTSQSSKPMILPRYCINGGALIYRPK